MVMPMSHFFSVGYTKNIADSPPAAAASVVLVATRPMPTASRADSVLPGLKPYQPNHRMTPPMAAMVRSWPGGHAAAVPLEPPAEAGAEDDGAGEGDHAADGVDHGGAGEVTEGRSHRGRASRPGPRPSGR